MDTPSKLEIQAKASKRLKEIIFNCHEDCLVELFLSHTKKDYDLAKYSFYTEEHLNMLEQMAAMGSKDAIAKLAIIGTRTAYFLDNLAGYSEHPEEHPETANEQSHEEGSLEKVCQKITEAARVLMAADLADLRKLHEAVDTRYPQPVLLPYAHGMFTHNIRVHLKKELSTADLAEIDEYKRNAAPTAEDLTEKAMKSLANKKKVQVDLILDCLLKHQAQLKAKMSVRNVLARCSSWPIAVSANTSNRANATGDRIKTLGLGSALGYKLQRTASPEYPTDWAQWVFSRLDGERRRSQNMTHSHKNEYKIYEESGDMPWLNQNGLMTDAEIKLHMIRTWNSLTHWQRQAALLPPPQEKDLSKWVEAAMSFFRSLAAEKIHAPPFVSGSFVENEQNRLTQFSLRRRSTTEEEKYYACIPVIIQHHARWKDSAPASLSELSWPDFSWTKEDYANHLLCLSKIRDYYERWTEGVEKAFAEAPWPGYLEASLRSVREQAVYDECIRELFKSCEKWDTGDKNAFEGYYWPYFSETPPQTNEEQGKYDTFIRKEIQLYKKWEKDVENAFSEFPWPDFVNDRLYQKPLNSALKEKIKSGLRRILKSIE